MTASEAQAANKTEAQTPTRHGWAVRSPLAIGLFLMVCATALAGDLLSKHVVFSSFLNRPECAAEVQAIRLAYRSQLDRDPDATEILHLFQRDVVPGVKFTLSTNPGVVFGMEMPRWAMLAAHGAAVLMIAVFFAASERRAWSVHLSLALILAGALGNFYDRLYSSVQLPGYEPIINQVRDFVDCSQMGYVWIFNLADAWLVIGVGILMLHCLFAGRKSHVGRK